MSLRFAMGPNMLKMLRWHFAVCGRPGAKPAATKEIKQVKIRGMGNQAD